MKKRLMDLVHFNRHIRRPLERGFMLMAIISLILMGVLGATALSADKMVDRKEGGLQSYPVAAGETVYKGALVVISSTGYLEALTDAASKRFAGVAYENKTNTTAAGYGSDGDLNCRVYTAGVFKLVCTSITQAMVGQMMYGVDDQTVDDTTGGTYYISIGRLVQYDSATVGWVDIGQRHLVAGADDVLLAPNSTNMLEVHTWGVVVKAVAGSCSLYLATDYGAYLNSYAAGYVEFCAATGLRLRIGGKGCNLDSTGILQSAYGFAISSGVFKVTGTGLFVLSHKTDPVTTPEEGGIWYNSDQEKLQFATSSGKETVTSA